MTTSTSLTYHGSVRVEAAVSAPAADEADEYLEPVRLVLAVVAGAHGHDGVHHPLPGGAAPVKGAGSALPAARTARRHGTVRVVLAARGAADGCLGCDHELLRIQKARPPSLSARARLMST